MSCTHTVANTSKYVFDYSCMIMYKKIFPIIFFIIIEFISTYFDLFIAFRDKLVNPNTVQLLLPCCATFLLMHKSALK